MAENASMDPDLLLALLLVLLCAAQLTELILQLLNLYALESWYRQKCGAAETPEFADSYAAGKEPEEDLQPRYRYQRSLQHLALGRTAVWSLLLLLFLGWRLPAWLYAQLDLLLRALSGMDSSASRLWQGVLFVALLQGLQFLVQLPWGLYRRFVIEERFGFNRMQPRDWFLDLLKSTVLGLLLGLPLLLGLFWLMGNLELWWLWGFLGLTGYQVLLLWLYPLLIAPLFNRFAPLAQEGSQGRLKQRLERLLAECGFAAKGLFVMDGSRRSKHSNAYFTGFGKSRRIVLFDTLIEELEQEPLAAVLAHEIGHYQRGHIPKMMVRSLLGLLLGFMGLYLLAHWSDLYIAFGFGGFEDVGGLAGDVAAQGPALLLFAGAVLSAPLGLPLQYLGNRLSRRHEWQADAYSVQVMGSSQPLREALCSLHRKNLSHPAPHSSYAAVYYSHPSLAERLAALGAD